MPRKRIHSYEQYAKNWYRGLSIWARELWHGLIDFADDEGFGSAAPSDLKPAIFRDDKLSPQRIEKLLEELQKAQQDDPMIVFFSVDNCGRKERYYWLPKFFDYQPTPDYPTPSKIAKLLIQKGKLDSKLAASTHRTFCRKSAERKQKRGRKTPSRTERPSNGVGVGLGVGVGVGVRGRSKRKESSADRGSDPDPRVARLLTWFGLSFKDTFGVTYMASFKADGKILRDQLKYADKSYPPGCAEVALALTMDEWLHKQKDLGQFKKTKIAGWLKDFNSINTEIDWQGVNWDELKKEYDDVQKKAKKDRA